MKDHLLYAKLSEQAYNDTVILKGFKTFDVSAGPSQAFLLKSNKLQIVVCRGTELNSICDLLADSALALDEGWHTGFKYYAELVTLNLKHLLDDRTPIVYTGHSMGGAIATILANQSTNKDITLYTYGSPRVSSLKGSVYHYRWAHAYDIVPMLPWWPFKHQGSLMFIAPDGNLCNVSLRKRWWLRLKGRYRFGNHFIRNYVECIENMSRV